MTRVPGEASEACKFDFYAAHGRALRERDDAVVLGEGRVRRAREQAGEERVDAVREQPTLDLRGNQISGAPRHRRNDFPVSVCSMA